MVFDRLYDIFIGIYILSWIGGHRFTVSMTWCCNLITVKNVIYLNMSQDYYKCTVSDRLVIRWIKHAYSYVSKNENNVFFVFGLIFVIIIV